jgi:hypothetical protein
MPYNVTIQNEEGVPMRGTVLYFDADHVELGQTVVYPSGTDLDIELVNAADFFRATADGYSWYGANISALGDRNTITLVKKPSTVTAYVVGGIVALLVYKLFFKKSFKL